MATNFPATLDVFTDPAGGDLQSVVLHHSQHDNANDSIAALEAKVGVNGSAVTTSLDNLIAALTTKLTAPFIVKALAANNTQIFQVQDQAGVAWVAANRTVGVARNFAIMGAGTEDAIVSLMAPNGTDYADFTYDGSNCEIDVSVGDLNLRPLGTGHNVNIWSIAGGSPTLKVGNQGFTTSVNLQHDGTSGILSTGTGNLLVKPHAASFVEVFSDTGQTKLRVGAQSFSADLALWHDGTNGRIESSAGFTVINEISGSGAICQFQAAGVAELEVLTSGQLNWKTAINSGTATAGSIASPGNFQGFLPFQIMGSTYKIPFFLN